MSKKTKLTDDMINNISKLLAAGNYITTVCEYLNIGQSTYFKWMSNGEKFVENKDKIKDTTKIQEIKLYEAVQKANASAEIRAVNEILTDESWQSKAWYLERRFGDRWGRKEKIEHSGSIDGKRDISLKHMSEEDLKKELEKYE